MLCLAVSRRVGLVPPVGRMAHIVVLVHWYCYIGTGTLVLLHWYGYIGTGTFGLLHWDCYIGTGTLTFHLPFPKATVNWFRVYKIPTGKPPNAFAFDGKAQDKVCCLAWCVA